ncbi:hypothetical protein E3U43_011771 [Larimichthys crocea]|uniref:Uncharacterized protein n=1 Tax=Larimichthys crocea TaxID=215358 RepID=A0ACD3QKP6_LARCR|nr:hypothetical protein E3U43_011771 [Larimichthys crocea]
MDSVQTVKCLQHPNLSVPPPSTCCALRSSLTHDGALSNGGRRGYNIKLALWGNLKLCRGNLCCYVPLFERGLEALKRSSPHSLSVRPTRPARNRTLLQKDCLLQNMPCLHGNRPQADPEKTLGQTHPLLSSLPDPGLH